LKLTASEKTERPKIEHILAKPSLEFFPLLNEISIGRIDPPIDRSRSTKLIKRIFTKQIEENEINAG
jgi:hypothetical protein